MVLVGIIVFILQLMSQSNSIYNNIIIIVTCTAYTLTDVLLNYSIDVC